MYFSYKSFYPTVSNLTYYLSMYLSLVYLIQLSNCQVNYIMIAITINYLDNSVYYNIIIKVVVLILFKNIYYQNS